MLITPLRRTIQYFALANIRYYSNWIKDGFKGTVGNTPLIKLNKLSQETGCDILVKAEFLNSGGSVKDRAALFLIKNAEEKGVYQAGILHIYVHKHFVKDK